MATTAIAGPIIASSPVDSASSVADNCADNDNHDNDDHVDSLTSESTATASTGMQETSGDETVVRPNGQNTPPPDTGFSGDVGLSLSHSPSPIGDDVVKESNHFGDEQLGNGRDHDQGVVNLGENLKSNSSLHNSSSGAASNSSSAAAVDAATAQNTGNVQNVPFAFPAAATLPLLPRSLVVNKISNIGPGINSLGVATMMQPVNALEQTTHLQINHEIQSTSNDNGDTSQSSSPPSNALEARILQLEQSLNALTQFCQTMMIQQQQLHQNQFAQPQQKTPGSSPTTTPNTPAHHRYISTDTRILSQWPPSQQPFLDSPEASIRRKSKHFAKPSKTMSMVLLDIDPGESRGPSMIPFTEDLDADDEMDGDSVEGEAGYGRHHSSGYSGTSDSSSNVGGTGRYGSKDEAGGGGKDSEEFGKEPNATEGPKSNEVPDVTTPTESSDESYTDSEQRSKGSRRHLSSSFKIVQLQENNLECQNYTEHHLDALKLRHEAGKIRAYSFNDAPLHNSTKTPESIQRWSAIGSGTKKNCGDKLPTIESPVPFRPTFDVLKTEKEHKSTVSTDTFVQVSPSADAPVKEGGPNGQEESMKKELDLLVPNLSSKVDANKSTPIQRKNVASVISTTNATKNLETHSIATKFDTDRSNPKIAPSASRSSINSSDTTKTLKSGSNSQQPYKIRANSVSSRERSSSNSSTQPEQQGYKAASCVATTTNTFKNTENNNDSKGSDKPTSKPQENKQTMLDYVKNDLLNIDSKHQDGSATEDIDANMEEFLRIPMKLENLMTFSLAVCVDTFLYVWTMLPLKVVWGLVCLLCTVLRPKKGIGGVMFHRRHLYALLQSLLVWFVYDRVLCPISIGKLYHWIRGQAMLKLYVLIAIVEVFDRLLCSFGQDAWDSLYWNTTRRPRHPRMLVSMIVVGVYVTIHSLFLFVHVATLSVAVNSADNALLTLLISGNFAEIKSTVFKKYNKQNLFKITTSDICERFKLALFLLLILLLNCFQGEMSKSMVFDYYSMCGIVLVAELISDWIKHSFITKFNFIKSSAYFDYVLILSGDVTGIGHEGLNLDYTHAAVKRLGLAQIPLVCVTARYLHEAVRFAIAFRGNGDIDHPLEALAELIADGNKWKFYGVLLGSLVTLLGFKIMLGVSIRYIARRNLGGDIRALNTISNVRKGVSSKSTKEVKHAVIAPSSDNADEKKKQ